MIYLFTIFCVQNWNQLAMIWFVSVEGIFPLSSHLNILHAANMHTLKNSSETCPFHQSVRVTRAETQKLVFTHRVKAFVIISDLISTTISSYSRETFLFSHSQQLCLVTSHNYVKLSTPQIRYTKFPAH